MLVALICYDRPYSTALRQLTREKHLAYVAQSGAAVKIAGPMLDDSGERMIGSLIILDVESLEAARDWAANDPYAQVGLFEHVDARPWRFLIEGGKPREGAAPSAAPTAP